MEKVWRISSTARPCHRVHRLRRLSAAVAAAVPAWVLFASALRGSLVVLLVALHGWLVLLVPTTPSRVRPVLCAGAAPASVAAAAVVDRVLALTALALAPRSVTSSQQDSRRRHGLQQVERHLGKEVVRRMHWIRHDSALARV